MCACLCLYWYFMSLNFSYILMKFSVDILQVRCNKNCKADWNRCHLAFSMLKWRMKWLVMKWDNGLERRGRYSSVFDNSGVGGAFGSRFLSLELLGWWYSSKAWEAGCAKRSQAKLERVYECVKEVLSWNEDGSIPCTNRQCRIRFSKSY